MKKGFKKTLAKYLFIGAGALATIFPSKLNAQSTNFMKSVPIYGKAPVSVIPTITLNGPTPLEVIGNPFSQPNIQEYLGRGKLDWYGSGDVNGDEKIDSTDLSAMNSMSNDRSDVDGDGTPSTLNDKKILSDYLGGKISYLPGKWNELKTRDERVSWLEKMIKVDKFDEQVLNLRQNAGWVCGDISTQMQINFYGISNINEFIQIVKTSSGKDFSNGSFARFNVPVYQFSTINKEGIAHSINGVLVGNDPLNFENWYKFSNFSGVDITNIKPGDAQMIDGPVSIGLEVYMKGPFANDPVFGYIADIISWNLSNGAAGLNNYKDYMLLLQNPNIIKPHVGALEKLVVDSGKFPDGTVLTPEFLKSHGYNAIPDTSKENTSLPINLSYIDGDTTKLSDTSYQFLRKFFAWIYSGGVTKVDSTTQSIKVDKITDVEISGLDVPKEFKIYQNYPNPYNPSTNIKYETTKFGDVRLDIYNLLGEKIESRIQRAVGPGVHEFKDINMSGYSSGMYIFRVSDGKNSKATKGILAK